VSAVGLDQDQMNLHRNPCMTMADAAEGMAMIVGGMIEVSGQLFIRFCVKLNMYERVFATLKVM